MERTEKDLYKPNRRYMIILIAIILAISLMIAGLVKMDIEIILATMICVIPNKQFIKVTKDLEDTRDDLEDLEHNIRWVIIYGALAIMSVFFTGMFFVTYCPKLFMSLLIVSIILSILITIVKNIINTFKKI